MPEGWTRDDRIWLDRLIAAGVAAMILFQFVVNIGMNLGLLPVTGIPLPFISYGGSSLLVSMAMMGILINIARHAERRVN